MLGEWVTNEDHRNIILAKEGTVKIGDFNADEKKELMFHLGIWRSWLGLKEEATKDEFKVVADFILLTYKDLSLKDIKNAMELSLAGKLDIDIRPYTRFAPLYVSNVLNAYRSFRKKALNEVARDWDSHIAKQRLLPKPAPSIEQQLEDLKNCIRTGYFEFKETGYCYDPFDIIYKWLLSSKKVDTTKFDAEFIEKGTAWATVKTKEVITEGHGWLAYMEIRNKTNIKDKKDFMFKKHKRIYVILEYFKKVEDIETEVSAINKDHLPSSSN